MTEQELIATLRQIETDADCDQMSWVWDTCGAAANHIEAQARLITSLKDCFETVAECRRCPGCYTVAQAALSLTIKNLPVEEG